MSARTEDSLDAQWEKYLDLLYAANRTLNLTRVPRELAATRHLGESLSLLPLAGWEDGSLALDLGSGGGVPGIPLALARPRVRFRLLERTQKKARFLERVVSELGLTNVEVVPQDSREHASSPGVVAPRYLVSRAAAPLPRLLPEVSRLLAPGGTALLLVGPGTAVPGSGALRTLGLRWAELVRTGPATVLRIRR